MPRPARRGALAVVALLALSCSGDGGADGSGAAGEQPTSTSPPATAAPTTTTTLDLELGAGAPAAPHCPAVPPLAEPAAHRPRYEIDLDVRPDEGLVEGRVAVAFTPDLPTDRLVFRLWPNGGRVAAAGGRLDPGEVVVDGSPAPADRPDPTTLVVPLDPPLAAGDTVRAELPWRLVLPVGGGDRVALADGAVRLGSFFPVLAWERGVGWALDPPTTGFAEASTSPAADVELTVVAPEGYGVLASGEEVEPGRWEATAVRDVGVSVGRFRLAEAEAHAPAPVRVVVGVDEAVGEAPQAYLDKVVRALEQFAARFGPYPWPTFSLAITAGLGGGIEYPTHVLQGPGTAGRTTSHEVGHQWFYALVGNNQGRDPWLDEGLATWAEVTFEATLAALARPIPAAAEGRAGAPMPYWDRYPSAYYPGVYLQGARAVAALGEPATVDCVLRTYVAAHAFDVATPADLLDAAEAVVPSAAEAMAPFGVVPAG